MSADSDNPTDPLLDERAWYGVDGRFDREGYEAYVVWTLPQPEPPEFPNVGCLLALAGSILFWVVLISVVTWLIIR